MNFKGQASLELLFVVIVVLSLIILVFASVPKDTGEIVVLGISKNNLDLFVLQTNYSGNYSLDANIIDKNLSISIAFNNANYDVGALSKTLTKIENDVKSNGNFENIYISYK